MWKKICLESILLNSFSWTILKIIFFLAACESGTKSLERFIPEGQCLEDEVMLHKTQQRLQEEKQLLEKERSSYTAAVIRLNKEVSFWLMIKFLRFILKIKEILIM